MNKLETVHRKTYERIKAEEKLAGILSRTRDIGNGCVGLAFASSSAATIAGLGRPMLFATLLPSVLINSFSIHKASSDARDVIESYGRDLPGCPTETVTYELSDNGVAEKRDSDKKSLVTRGKEAGWSSVAQVGAFYAGEAVGKVPATYSDGYLDIELGVITASALIGIGGYSIDRNSRKKLEATYHRQLDNLESSADIVVS